MLDRQPVGIEYFSNSCVVCLSALTLAGVCKRKHTMEVLYAHVLINPRRACAGGLR